MDRSQWLDQTLSVIEARIHDKLSVAELAGSVYLSRYHYQRLFCEAMGESVMRYVAKRRMELAARELAGTGLSVLEIALRYGYDTHEGFTRSFRAHMGMTPTEYRRSCSGKIDDKGCKNMCETASMKQEEVWKELTRQLEALAGQAREAAGYMEAFLCPVGDAEGLYAPLWQAAAERTRELSGRISQALGDAGRPGRRSLLRVLEDAALSARVTSLQAGITMARALPAHRAAYAAGPCARLERLAQAAGSASGHISGLLAGLDALLHREIRETGRELLNRAAKSGREIAEGLPPELPYDYIARGIGDICTKLAAPAGDIDPKVLEDCLTQLDILSFSARIDQLRAPEHGALFDRMAGFRGAIEEARDFFGGLPMVPELPGPALISSLPVFCLRSELEKLGPRLEPDRQARLWELLVRLERDGEPEAAWRELRREADELGDMGAVLAYLCGHR